MALNLGTVFVELSLDDKVYKQRLSETLTSTEATAKGIETSWKALGTKSEAVFNSQRLAAENAYTLIKNSAASTANDIVRAEQAKNEKIMSLNTQQFGAQTSMLSTLKSNWIAASAAIYAAIAVINKGIALMDEGAKAMATKSAFQIMAKEAGVSGEAMLASMEKATKGTVADSELMQKAQKLMLAGYSPDQIVRFSQVVIAASQYMGTTVAEAYDRITDSVATRMPRAMVQSGAITREQMQIVTAAIKAGASQSELLELAIANLQVQTLELKGVQNEATLAMQRYHKEIKELQEDIGIGLVKALGMAIEAVDKFDKAIKSAGAGGGSQGYKDFARKVDEFFGIPEKATNLGMTGASGGAGGAWSTGVVQHKPEDPELTAAKKRADDRTAQLKALGDASKDAKDILKSVMDENKRAYEEVVEAADHASKMQILAGQNELNFALSKIKTEEAALATKHSADAAAINTYVKDAADRNEKLKALDADYNLARQKLEDKKPEEALKISNFVRDSSEAMYKDINKYSQESVAAQIAEIDRWAEKQKVAGANEVLIAQATSAKKLEVYRKNADDIAKALSSAYSEIAKSPITSAPNSAKYSDLALQNQLQEFKNQKTEMLKVPGFTEDDWQKWYNSKAFEAILQTQVAQVKAAFDAMIGAAQLTAEAIDAATLSGLEHVEKFSNDTSVGVKAAFLRMKLDAMTWSKATDEIITSFAHSAETSLSTVLFDAAKGKMKTFQDYWTAFSDAILKTFTDAIAKMIVQWALGQQTMAAASSATSGTGLLGSFLSLFGMGGGGGGTMPTPTGDAVWVAQGNAFDRGNVIPFARGGIVDRPTLFPMAGGAGLMGEAGPEGVLPLKRTRSGKLGVATEGSEKSNVINITNIVSPDLMDSYLATSRGQNAVLNVISSKSGTVRRVLRK